MEYKPDWDAARTRLVAWWKGGCIDRVALQVRAPRRAPAAGADDPPATPPPPAIGPSPSGAEADLWLDADRRLAAAEDEFARTFYGGEAFPYYDPHLGPGSFALFLGSQPRFAPDTVWYLPAAGLAAPEALRLDGDNRWWRETIRLLEHGVRRAAGRFPVAVPDLIEGLDTLASLLGAEDLLTALVEHPDEIHRHQARILDLWFDAFDAIQEIVRDERGGNCFSAFQIWAPGPMAKLQCDIAACLGPREFEAFAAPYLAEQCRRLAFSLFHLDGVDAVKHLDALLAIPDLDAIQWTPGANRPGVGSASWLPLYRRIRTARKALLLIDLAPEEAEDLVRALGPEGLLLALTVGSQDEAEALLSRALAWA
ncbi:MAG: hypothetical protein JXP34_01375 [Planctomycetes bacterium]|nr:hypothetical protein [Planctomycetota bacterium]